MNPRVLLLRNHKRKNAENVPALILACGMVFIGISLTLEEAGLLRDSSEEAPGGYSEDVAVAAHIGSSLHTRESYIREGYLRSSMEKGLPDIKPDVLLNPGEKPVMGECRHKEVEETHVGWEVAIKDQYIRINIDYRTTFFAYFLHNYTLSRNRIRMFLLLRMY